MLNLLPSAGAFLTRVAVAVSFEKPPKISKTNKKFDILSFGAFCPLRSLRGKQKGLPYPCGAQNTHKESMGHKSFTVPAQLSLSHPHSSKDVQEALLPHVGPSAVRLTSSMCGGGSQKNVRRMAETLAGGRHKSWWHSEG